MPKLSSFYGIRISIRTRETNHRLPHFHAKYAGQEISIAIATLEILAGEIERRALVMVLEWAFLHRDELQAAWDTLRAGGIPNRIDPLR